MNAQPPSEYKKYWAKHITVTDLKLQSKVEQVINPPLAVVLKKEKIKVFAKTYQEYDIVSKGKRYENRKQWSMTWMCVDQRGVNAKITFGVVYGEGTQLMITYYDYSWTYKLKEKS
jgi:hypothetical protein